MIRTGRKKEWSILLFVASLILFLPPVLKIFDRADLFFNIPLSYMYFFGVWALVILFTALGARRRMMEEDDRKTGKADNGPVGPRQESS
jgi:hypothetical protein